MSHLVCAHPWELVSASATATSVLKSMISYSEGRAAEFVRPPVRASTAEQVAYRLADRERCGEARGLDAEEIDEARDAVVGRALDEKIAGRLAARLELGPDSGIRGLQGAVREARPVAAYGAVENLRAPRVDVIVDPLDPFDIGTETRLAGQIEGQVHAENHGLGRELDKPVKRP